MHSLSQQLFNHLCIITLIFYNRVTHVSGQNQTVSELVQTFSEELEGIMCEGLRVGGDKCSNGLFGIQDFIDSFINNFEDNTATINASETAQIIIDRLNNKLASRSSILRNLSALIQSDCASFDASDIDFDDLYFAGNADRSSNLPNDISFSELYGTSISLTASTYKLPDAVSYDEDRIQYDAKISQLLDAAMVDLHATYCIDSDDVHEYCSMYYGTINGVFRRFPGVESYVDYDPRFKPWYASAVMNTGSTEIVILLDSSAAMQDNNRMTLAKSAVTSVLNTMGSNTYVNIIAFGDSLTQSCFEDEAIAATPRNIAQLSEFVDGLVPSGSADFTTAFGAAFDIFTTSTSCRRAILFLTHGDGTDVTDLVLERNDKVEATIFSYTLGDDATSTVPKSVAEATNGIYTHIDDADDLINAMSSYYLYYSHGASSNAISFSSPYLDEESGVVLISMSQAVYIDSYFVGVVGTDIPLTSLSDAIGDITIGHKSYTFVMNEESELLLHPLISSPSELFDSDTNEYKPIYASDAEPQEFIGNVLDDMLDRNNGYQSIAATVKLPAGNVVYNGYRTELADLLYIYAGVGPSSLSIAIVVYTELDVDAPNIPAFGMNDAPSKACNATGVDTACVAPFNMYHRIDLASECSSSWLDDAQILNASDSSNAYYNHDVNAFYEGKLYSVENPIYFLQAGLWEHLQDALNTDPTCSELSELQDLTNQNGGVDVTNLPYDGIRAEIAGNVLNGIYTLTQLHQFWKDAVLNNDLKFSSVWFGQYQGLHISYPGKVFSATYNNLIRPWYQRAISYPDSFVWITPYLHHNTGKLVTGASAVITAPNRDYPYGVTSFATEYASTFVSYYKSTMSSACGTGNKVCYLIDSSAFLLYYDGMEDDVGDSDISIKFLGDFEPTLMQSLLDRAFFQSEENVNFAKDTNDISYIVDDTLDFSSFASTPTAFQYNSGNYTVHSVSKTNLYLIHIEGYHVSSQYPTDCPENLLCSDVISPGCIMNATGTGCESATVDVCTEAETRIKSYTCADNDDIGACILQLDLQSDSCASDFADVSCDESTISNLIQIFSNQLESVMCDGLRVGGDKCSNSKYGIQDFIDSFVGNFESSIATVDASETAQIIIDRLDRKLNSRTYFLSNMTAIIQSQCENDEELNTEFDDLYFAGNSETAANLPDDMESSDVYGYEISLTASTFKIPDTASATDENIRWDAIISQLLDETMIDLYNTYCIDSDEVHEYCSMYFGTVNGVFTQYPGVENVKDDDDTYMDYDPRFEPWYVSAVSGMKDVVILLDVSSSMEDQMDLAKSAVTHVLNTMGSATFVNIIAFSDSVEQSCFGDDLVAATTRNKAQLIDFASSLEATTTSADYTVAFAAAFDILDSGESCKKAIIFLTYGDGDDVSELTVDNDVTIFSYTLGKNAESSIPQTVAEESNGIYTHINDADNDLINAMSSYYLYYSHGASSNAISFSSPYLDEESGVVLLSMSQAVYIDSYFVGVVGTDIPLTSLSDAIGDITIGHKSYTFVMNEESELLLHPLISSPSELFDSDTNEYKPIYASDAEPQEFIGNVLDDMLDRNDGYQSIAATVKLPAGNVVYNGYRTELADLLYIYAGVGPSSLSIAIVVYTELDVEAPNVPAFGLKGAPTDECSSNSIDSGCVAPFNMYHRIDLASECSSSWLDDAQILNASDSSNAYYDYDVNEFYEGKLYSVENPIYFLQAGLWEHEYDALNTDPSCSELSELHELSNQDGTPDFTNLPYDGIRSEISQSVLNGIYTLTQLHQFWKDAVLNNDLKFSSVWFGQYQGLHISYPGKVFSATYNNLIRPWYQRAISYPDSFVWITPYLHHNTGKLVTGASAVITAPNNEDYPYGVTSFAVEYAAFVEYWLSIMDAECDQSSNQKCYLIDSSAFLLYYDGMEDDVEDDDISIKFLGDFEPTLMQSLLDRGFFQSGENVNFAQDTNDISYIVDDDVYNLNLQSFQSFAQSFAYNSGNYSVYHVAKTNLYVIHIEGYQISSPYPTDCPDDDLCSDVISPGCIMDETGTECESATNDVCTEAETSIMAQEEECDTSDDDDDDDDLTACILNIDLQFDICAAADEYNDACDNKISGKGEKSGLKSWIVGVIIVAAVLFVVVIVATCMCCNKDQKTGRAYVPTNVDEDRPQTVDQQEMGLVTNT